MWRHEPAFRDDVFVLDDVPHVVFEQITKQAKTSEVEHALSFHAGGHPWPLETVTLSRARQDGVPGPIGRAGLSGYAILGTERRMPTRQLWHRLRPRGSETESVKPIEWHLWRVTHLLPVWPVSSIEQLLYRHFSQAAQVLGDDPRRHLQRGDLVCGLGASLHRPPRSPMGRGNGPLSSRLVTIPDSRG